MGGVHLHVRACAPLFYISVSAGRVVLKFGGWLGVSRYAFYAITLMLFM